MQDAKAVLQKELDRAQAFRQFVHLELSAKDAIIQKLEEQVELFKENVRRMRAVLRVPRLCTMYHDMIRRAEMPEFDCLDDIYERHYTVVRKEAEKKNEGPHPMSIAERAVVNRSLS